MKTTEKPGMKTAEKLVFRWPDYLSTLKMESVGPSTVMILSWGLLPSIRILAPDSSLEDRQVEVVMAVLVMIVMVMLVILLMLVMMGVKPLVAILETTATAVTVEAVVMVMTVMTMIT